MYFFSKTTCGFYDTDTHGDSMPSDVVEITADLRAALLDGLKEGVRIDGDDTGYPVLVPVIKSPEFQAAQVRAERDRRMAAAQWRYERLARETRLGLPLSDDLGALDAYMQALADVTDQAGFPAAVDWPEALK